MSKILIIQDMKHCCFAATPKPSCDFHRWSFPGERLPAGGGEAGGGDNTGGGGLGTAGANKRISWTDRMQYSSQGIQRAKRVIAVTDISLIQLHSMLMFLKRGLLLILL